jgi:hypothetical protein
MPVTLPIEVYEAFEKGFGKEDAKKVVKSLEATISEATEYKWKTTKDELLDARNLLFRLSTAYLLGNEVRRRFFDVAAGFTCLF